MRGPLGVQKPKQIGHEAWPTVDLSTHGLGLHFISSRADHPGLRPWISALKQAAERANGPFVSFAYGDDRQGDARKWTLFSPGSEGGDLKPPRSIGAVHLKASMCESQAEMPRARSAGGGGGKDFRSHFGGTPGSSKGWPASQGRAGGGGAGPDAHAALLKAGQAVPGSLGQELTSRAQPRGG